MHAFGSQPNQYCLIWDIRVLLGLPVSVYLVVILRCLQKDQNLRKGKQYAESYIDSKISGF